MNYQLLKQSLDLVTGVRWLPEDSKDDFFPDPVGWRDIERFPDDFLQNREHRILQVDAVPHLMEYVPKKSGLLREAVWLHPCHRALYLAILHRFLPRLDPRMCEQVYSYRCDEPSNAVAYPFGRKMERWKTFHNDFRRAALDKAAGAVLVTDLASHFDHIQVDQLIDRMRGVLAGVLDSGDEEVLSLLARLLRMWGENGFGMPHNLDPSSFFGSFYLHNVDREIVGARYKYFRWIDDIKIVAKNREQALRALHDLQKTLARHRLFLATDKTSVIERGTDEYAQLLDVSDDILISTAEEVIARKDRKELEGIVDRLFERLEYHSTKAGDDRKFRAFANRLLDIADFAEVQRDITPRIHEFVVPRLRSFPERTDYWAKMLSTRPSDRATGALQELLITTPSIFDWQRFRLWKLATALPGDLLPGGLFAKAEEVGSSTLSNNVASQSIVFLGRHGDNTLRENLFARHFSSQRSYVVQRAVLVAIQELPGREAYFKRALEINSDHRELVQYLQQCKEPDYGIKPRAARHCAEEPIEFQYMIQRGIGLAGGQVASFRLTRGDYDY